MRLWPVTACLMPASWAEDLGCSSNNFWVLASPMYHVIGSRLRCAVAILLIELHHVMYSLLIQGDPHRSN